VIKQIEQPLDHNGPHSRVAFSEGIGAQQNRGAHRILRQGFTAAAD
jgi:hypothetical protein